MTPRRRDAARHRRPRRSTLAGRRRRGRDLAHRPPVRASTPTPCSATCCCRSSSATSPAPARPAPAPAAGGCTPTSSPTTRSCFGVLAARRRRRRAAGRGGPGVPPAGDAVPGGRRARGAAPPTGRSCRRGRVDPHDVTVLDLTAMWAGPLATMQLAAWGAEVVTVEPPFRRDGLRGSPAQFAVLDAGQAARRRGTSRHDDDRAALRGRRAPTPTSSSSRSPTG